MPNIFVISWSKWVCNVCILVHSGLELDRIKVINPWPGGQDMKFRDSDPPKVSYARKLQVLSNPLALRSVHM